MDLTISEREANELLLRAIYKLEEDREFIAQQEVRALIKGERLLADIKVELLQRKEALCRSADVHQTKPGLSSKAKSSIGSRSRKRSPKGSLATTTRSGGSPSALAKSSKRASTRR